MPTAKQLFPHLDCAAALFGVVRSGKTIIERAGLHCAVGGWDGEEGRGGLIRQLMGPLQSNQPIQPAIYCFVAAPGASSQRGHSRPKLGRKW